VGAEQDRAARSINLRSSPPDFLINQNQNPAARSVLLDQFVRAQVAGTGSNLQNSPVNLYTMLPQGQFDPKGVAQDFAQVFTGVRVQCAQCHNHPFDRWTQEDYYGFVSFFTGVKRKTESESREFYIWDDPAPHSCYPTHWMSLPEAP